MQNLIKKISFLILLVISNDSLTMNNTLSLQEDQQAQYPAMRAINFVGVPKSRVAELDNVINRCMKEIAKNPTLIDAQELNTYGETDGKKSKELYYIKSFSDEALEKFNLNNAQTKSLINTLWRSAFTYSNDPDSYRLHLQNMFAHVINAAKPVALLKAEKVLRELQTEQQPVSNNYCAIKCEEKEELYVGIFTPEDEIMTKREASQKIRGQIIDCWPQINTSLETEMAETSKKIFEELILILHADVIRTAAYSKTSIDAACDKIINGSLPKEYKDTLENGLNKSRDRFTKNLCNTFFLFSWSAQRLTEPYYLAQIARLTHALETAEEKKQSEMREKDLRIVVLERALQAMTHAQPGLFKVDVKTQNIQK